MWVPDLHALSCSIIVILTQILYIPWHVVFWMWKMNKIKIKIMLLQNCPFFLANITFRIFYRILKHIIFYTSLLTVDSRHNFLKIHHGSEVTAVPEIIEGDLMSGNLTAGYYQEIGERFSDASTTAMGTYLNLRPRRPFGASSSVWRKFVSSLPGPKNFTT